MLGRKRQDPLVHEPIEMMDERFPYWLSKVLNIGQPVMDTEIDTAAIQFDPKSGDFTFKMNPEFASQLTTEERAFLMSHEAMHVVRNDMRTHADPKYPDKDALNKAMDAIINDTLTNAGMTAPEWAVNGMRDVGYDCEDAGLDEVYRTLTENQEDPPDQQDGDGDEGGDGDDDEQESDGKGQSDDDDNEGDDEADAEGDDDDEGDDSDGQSDGDPQEGDDDGDDGDDADGDGEGESEEAPPKPMAGGGHSGWGEQEGIEDAAEQHNESSINANESSDGAKKYEAPEESVTADQLDSLDYDAMLNLVEPELVDGFGMGHPARADWSRPNRRTMGLYPHTHLPSRKDDTRKLALASKRLQLVVFIDNSGSITHEDIELFRKLAKRLPKARADYRFVAASSNSAEVPAEVLLDETKPLPDLGNASGLSHARRVAMSPRQETDEWRTANVIANHPGGWRSRKASDGPAGSGINEFDAMNAWIKVAIEDGRLRSYPKSVMVISDGESMLSSATPEEAERWQVFINRPIGHVSLSRGLWRNTYDCRIPQENIHRLGDFLLTRSHVRTKARV
jgi:predicted metal-dependent peptidase